MSLEASTTSPPLGSTWVTRAVSVVVRVVDRLVVPWPLSCGVAGRVGQVGQRPGGLGDAGQGGDRILGAGGALRLGGAGGDRRSLLRHHDGEQVVHLAGAHVAGRVGQPRAGQPDGAGRGRTPLPPSGLPLPPHSDPAERPVEPRASSSWRPAAPAAINTAASANEKKRFMDSPSQSTCPTETLPFPSTRAKKRLLRVGIAHRDGLAGGARSLRLALPVPGARRRSAPPPARSRRAPRPWRRRAIRRRMACPRGSGGAATLPATSSSDCHDRPAGGKLLARLQAQLARRRSAGRAQDPLRRPRAAPPPAPSPWPRRRSGGCRRSAPSRSKTAARRTRTARPAQPATGNSMSPSGAGCRL